MMIPCIPKHRAVLSSFSLAAGIEFEQEKNVKISVGTKLVTTKKFVSKWQSIESNIDKSYFQLCVDKLLMF